MSQLIEYAQRIEDSQLATALHESLYAFPLLEGTHLLGLALSVGLLAIIDLRLLGLILTDIPKEQLLKQLEENKKVVLAQAGELVRKALIKPSL